MAGEAAPARTRSPLLRSPFVWAFLLGIVILTLIRPCLRRVPAAPPVTGRLPGFAFVDFQGRRFGPERLAGAVWIIHFFYRGCGADCAAAMNSLKEIRQTYADLRIEGIRVLSLSVDPGSDTPERLAAFAAAERADPARWLVATGEPAELLAFAAAAFGQEAPAGGGAPAGPGDGPPLAWLARAGRMLIVDPGGGLRGTYAGDAAGMDEVYNRAQHVREEFRGRMGGPPAGPPGGRG
jgi:cytochrome oxidase Cu insertion factor (SCO1/SenC/PrrC family)